MYPSYSPLFTLGLLADASSRTDDDTSPIYFTLHSGKRDSVGLRSFLSLDKRKFSLLSKSTSTSDHHDSAPSVSARRRTSKESLRSIPSPKPAPSATLPEPPTSAASPRVLKKRPASTVISSLLSPAPRVRRPVSLCSESISSHERRKSRMDALACLEGRSRVPSRVPRSSGLRNNFMSFSDDEDERSISRKSMTSAPVVAIEDLSAFADVEDEVDAVDVPRKRDAVTKPARLAKPGRRRRSTIENWFPLKSFIDFKDDDLSSWNWRSFIEIGGVS